MNDTRDTHAGRTSIHRAAWDLIPWVVAGGASATEREIVEQHAKACADCAEELEFHRQLQAGMIASDDAPAVSPEPAMARLMARIDDAEPAVPALRPGRPGRGTTALRWLAAAAVVQAIGLGTLARLSWDRSAGPSVAAYRTLSQQPAATGASIRLVASPAMTLADLQSVLAAQHLRIVDSSDDGKRLGLVAASDDAAAVDAAIARLRRQSGVLLAEPIRRAP